MIDLVTVEASQVEATQLQMLFHEEEEEEDGVIARFIPLHPQLPKCDFIWEELATNGYTVGRSAACNVCIPVPTLSQEHCKLILVSKENQEPCFILQDNSTNERRGNYLATVGCVTHAPVHIGRSLT